MLVSVNFCGLQRKLACTDQIYVPLLKETRVNEVLRYIKSRYPELPLTEDAVLVTVNNRLSPLDQVLKPKDRISFVPHIGGG